MLIHYMGNGPLSQQNSGKDSMNPGELPFFG